MSKFQGAEPPEEQQWVASFPAHKILGSCKITIDNCCAQCGKKNCGGFTYCEKWKKYRPCDIVSDEFWDKLNALKSPDPEGKPNPG